ncbi:hypothetical protein caldi_25120 [Caldinitratiruptor microaerophilus]|uniref:Uncharacterized protein n=1 Tax=Caldinitratiruptor microaerophilus TaxID=671077 RepID=A0AA35CP99_9FIRM|nr:hypothetical protein caldi_25120 [Caldinitratiruptor microaerophilus]
MEQEEQGDRQAADPVEGKRPHPRAVAPWRQVGVHPDLPRARPRREGPGLCGCHRDTTPSSAGPPGPDVPGAVTSVLVGLPIDYQPTQMPAFCPLRTAPRWVFRATTAMDARLQGPAGASII